MFAAVGGTGRGALKTTQTKLEAGGGRLEAGGTVGGRVGKLA